MKNIIKAILSVFAAAFLITLCIVVSAVAIAISPVYFLCALIFYGAESCAALTNSVIAWAKDSIGFAHNKEVVFRLEPDSPDGIKLSDIANGKCVEYNGVDLRGALQYVHSTMDEPDSPPRYTTPVLLVSSSGQHFLGCDNAIYPVQPPMKRPAHLFPPHRKTSPLDYTWMRDMDDDLVDDRNAVREIVLGTGFVVTGPRTNDVRLQSTENERSDLSRVKLIIPSVVLSKTRGMTPTRSALLSPHVVQDDSESVFLRRYVALARACMNDDGEPLGLQWDIYANMQQFMHVLTYSKGAISHMDAAFLSSSVRRVDRDYKVAFPAYDEADYVRHLRNVLFVLGLSQSEEAMFKPIPKQGKLWLVSEFIHSKQFQNAVISAAMASMTSSIDRGIVSREDILKGMPYLCKQIPGLCEAVYTIVRAAKYNGSVCDEGELSNLALYSIANVLRTQGSNDALDLPDVDEGSAFEGMSERAVERFDALKDSAFRMSHSSHDSNNVDEVYKIGRHVLQNKHCSEIIAYLVAHNIRSNGMRAGGVFRLHSHDMSDNLIVEYVRADSILREHALALGTRLELADVQECEMRSHVVETSIRKFPWLEHPAPKSDTSLESSGVTAVGAESRATGRPAIGAANA